MRKKCIVSYAVKGREDYPKALWRMIRSVLKNTDDVDILYYSDQEPDCFGELDQEEMNKWSWRVRKIGHKDEIPNHDDFPYAFKPYLINIAKDLGYTQVLWFDSTIYVHKSLEPVFKAVRMSSVTSSNNENHPLYEWISQYSLCALNGGSGFDWKNERMKQITACWIGFNFDNHYGKMIFSDWLYFSTFPDVFKGKDDAIKSHRHDQAALSYLMYKKSEYCTILDYGSMFSYFQVMSNYKDIIFTNRGVYL